MPTVTLAAQARDDLIAIWGYVAQEHPAAADRLLDAIGERMGLLADHPLLGPARPDIAPDLRYLVADNYLILYRLAGADVEVVRVLHGARNLSALFENDER